MIKEPRIAADILVMPHGAKLLSHRFKGGDEVVSQPHLVQKGGGSETVCQSLSVHVSRMSVQTDIASIGTSIAFRRLLVCVKSRAIQLGMCKSNGFAVLAQDNRGEHLLRSQRQRQIPT
jgi:hypothetical protein